MPERVAWGAGREQAFVSYITDDLLRALADRKDLEKKWRDWLSEYRALLPSSVKRFPFDGASNYTLPVAAMNADPLIARFVTTLHTPPNLWTLQPLNERWVAIAKPMQDYLQYLDHTSLHMYNVDYRALVEFVKLGTLIFKTGWFFENRRVQDYDSAGRIVQRTKFVSAPFVDHVSLVDFILPAEAYEIQADQPGGARWVGERFWLSAAQFRARSSGQEPFLPNYDPARADTVAKFEENRAGSGAGVEDERYKLDRAIPSNLRRIELFEINARFDTRGDGSVDDVVAILHAPSRTLLRAIYNPYRHGLRPYTVARYFRSDGFFGIGACEQAEMFQEVLSKLLNYQLDNVLLVNSPMLGVKFGANVVPGEPVYPLKIWPLDDPSKDIREIKFSEVYPSLMNTGAIVQNWGERRTGINDIQLGNPSQLPSRTPATTMLSLLQEGNRRFDLSLKDLRAALDEVGLLLLQNLQQFMADPSVNPEADNQLRLTVMALGEPEGGYVAQALALPLERIEEGLGVSVTATSGSVNKEVEKQSFLALVQLQAQLAAQYLQLAQVVGNPMIQQQAPIVAQVAAQVFKGFSELQRRLLEQFDIRNPEDILVDAAVLMDAQAGGGLAAFAPGGAGMALGALPGAGGGPGFPAANSPMGGLPAGGAFPL